MGRFSFYGRLERTGYNISLLVLYATVIILGTLNGQDSLDDTGLIFGLVMLGFIVYYPMLIVQRLRDIGVSGWMILLCWLPLVNVLMPMYLMISPTDSHKKKD